MNTYPLGECVVRTLSTDRPFLSSALFRVIPLARTISAALCGFSLLAAHGSDRQRLNDHVRRTSVGNRLAADLRWSQQERDTRFAHMERLFPVHIVPRGMRVRPLPQGTSLVGNVVHKYMRDEHMAGILVLQHGSVRAEEYALGTTRGTRRR